MDDAWWRPLAPPLALLYGAGVWTRNQLFDRGVARAHRLPGRVVSVGNLVAGGTGKSPITMALARLLQAAGQRPAILTRGYGSALAADDSLVLLDGRELLPPRAPVAWPDEAHMQTRALPGVPVIVGRRRYAAALRYLATAASPVSHWLLDDGFQHRQIERDLDVVLLDAAAPFDNGRLLPRGMLREPPPGLRRAGLVVFTRCAPGLPDGGWDRRIGELAGGAPVVRAFFRPGPLTPVPTKAVSAGQVRGRVLLATGVARPEQVREALRALGVDVGATYFVADHAPFAPARLAERLGAAAAVVTTAKDYWRNPDIFAELPVPCYLLGMSVEWDERAVKERLGLG